MRSFHDRRSPRPRPRLHLEALEDRHLLSHGGLLSALAPAAVLTAQAALPPLVNAAATASGVGGSLLAGPSQTAVAEMAAPLTAASSVSPAAPLAAVDEAAASAVPAVSTTAADIGYVLSGLSAPPAATSAPRSGATGGVDVGVSLNVGLGDVAATVGVAAAVAPQQSPASLNVAATADLGGRASVAPDLSAAVGGSNVVTVEAGTSNNSAPSSSDAGGASTLPPAAAPSTLDALFSAPLSLVAPVTAAVADLGGALLGGATPQPTGSPAPGATSGTTGGLGLGVDLLGVTANVALPATPDQPLIPPGAGTTVGAAPSTGGVASVAVGGSGAAAPGADSPTQTVVAPPAPDGVAPSDPVPLPPPVAVGGEGTLPNSTTDASDVDYEATNLRAPAVDADVMSQTPDSPTSPPAPQVVAAPSEAAGTQAAVAAAAGGNSAPGAAAASPASVGRTADGGGDAGVNSGAATVTADAPSSATLNGAGADAVAPPDAANPADGAASAPAAANLAPDASGLATRFQPFGLDRVRQGLTQLAHRIAPPGGWLAGLLNRLAAWAPWLAGLVLGGAAFEIRRRRRRAALRETPR